MLFIDDCAIRVHKLIQTVVIDYPTHFLSWCFLQTLTYICFSNSVTLNWLSKIHLAASPNLSNVNKCITVENKCSRKMTLVSVVGFSYIRTVVASKHILILS